MNKAVKDKRSFCVLCGSAGVAGVVLLIVSFAINAGPPPGAMYAELVRFGQQHYANVLWGAWLQATGPVLIVLFAFSLVHLARAEQSFAGWMTFFGATILMTVSLIEITFYISALHPDPAVMPAVSLNIISAVQHLYFIVAAPALFSPLGVILLSSPVLPQSYGVSALILATAFTTLGIIFFAHSDVACMGHRIRGSSSALVAGAAITLIARSGKLSDTSAVLLGR